MRQRIVNLGRTWTTVLITLLSIVMSVLITEVVVLVVASPVPLNAIMTSIVVPAIVAPITTWFVVGLVIRIHHLEEEQRRLATFDHLTGAMSRRQFMENSTTLLKQCLRNKEHLTIAIIDLDDFKAINDTYGHGGGDKVLTAFSKVMHTTFRRNDIIGRIGGEEFAVAFFGINMDNSLIALERLRVAAEKDTVPYLDKEISYTISIGVSTLDWSTITEVDQMIKFADDALYRAKASGKNSIQQHA